MKKFRVMGVEKETPWETKYITTLYCDVIPMVGDLIKFNAVLKSDLEGEWPKPIPRSYVVEGKVIQRVFDHTNAYDHQMKVCITHVYE